MCPDCGGLGWNGGDGDGVYVCRACGGTGTRAPKAKRLGWHVISGEQLLEMLKRVEAGESPDMVYAEEYANAEHERIAGG